MGFRVCVGTLSVVSSIFAARSACEARLRVALVQMAQNPQQLGMVMQMMQLQQAAAAGQLPGGLPGMGGLPGLLPPNMSFAMLQAVAGGGGINGGAGMPPAAQPASQVGENATCSENRSMLFSCCLHASPTNREGSHMRWP